MKVNQFGVELIKEIPLIIEDGRIYISLDYKVSIHNCPCGCGQKVVLPIDPRGWSILFNGETISFSPSIGNWSLDCKSHYFITKNRVEWVQDKDEKSENKNFRRKKKNVKSKIRTFSISSNR